MMSKQYKLKLSQAEINHIKSLLLENQRNGTYCEPKAQYWNRHYKLLVKLNETT